MITQVARCATGKGSEEGSQLGIKVCIAGLGVEIAWRPKALCLDVHALRVFLIPGRILSRRAFRVSPLKEVFDLWDGPGLVELGPIVLGRLVEPISSRRLDDPPTVTGEEKWSRWTEYSRCLPFYQLPHGKSGLVGQLTYCGQGMFDITVNLLYGRLYYGPFHIGGRCPWYSLRTLPPPGTWRWRDPTLLLERNDDVALLPHYASAEAQREETARFWQDVDRVTGYVRRLAWQELIEQLRARRLWKTLAALRMVLGATWWLNRHLALASARGHRAVRRLDVLLHQRLAAEDREYADAESSAT